MKQSWINGQRRSIAFIGVSGVGKTTLSRLFPDDQWLHYSVDYRIWTHYMSTHLNDFLKTLAMQQPVLAELLHKDAITVEHRVHFNNLLATSRYMGMLGNPALGGTMEVEFRQRMAHYREQERAAMLDIPYFRSRAMALYNYPHFITDASGSICEVVDPSDPNDPVTRCLIDNSLIVYLKASPNHIKELLRRAKDDPKPIYYRPEFLDEHLPRLCRRFHANSVEEISPLDAGVYLYEQVLLERLPRYEALSQHGVTLEMDEIERIDRHEQLFLLIEHKLRT